MPSERSAVCGELVLKWDCFSGSSMGEAGGGTRGMGLLKEGHFLKSPSHKNTESAPELAEAGFSEQTMGIG